MQVMNSCARKSRKKSGKRVVNGEKLKPEESMDSYIPAQYKYNNFQTHIPFISHHPQFLTHTPSMANPPKKSVLSNDTSQTLEASVPRGSDTSEMLAHFSNEMECTTRPTEIRVKLLY
jgi:hypothetical protein